MSTGILSEKLSKLFSSFSTPRRKAILGVILLFLWTKVGVPNLLYVLQYLGCIIKIGVFKKRIKYAATTAMYKTRVHIYDIGMLPVLSLVHDHYDYSRNFTSLSLNIPQIGGYI